MPLRRLIPLFALLLGLAFLGLVGRSVRDDWRHVQRAHEARHAVDQLQLTLLAAEMVSRERGPTNGALGSTSPLPETRATALREARARTDAAWAALAPVLSEHAPDGQAAARLQRALREARAGVDSLIAQPRDQRSSQDIGRAVGAMVALVPLLTPTSGLLAAAAAQQLATLSDAVQGARLSAGLRESAGLLGSHFTAAFTRQQPFTAAENEAIERTRGRIDALRSLLELRVQMPGQVLPVQQAWALVEQRYFGQAQQLLAGVIESGRGDGRYSMDPAGFAARYVPEMDSLFAMRDVWLSQAAAIAQAESDRSIRQLWVTAATATLLLALLLAGMLHLQRRLLRPLLGVTQALNALARDDTLVPLPSPLVPDEVAGVISAVAKLQQHSRDRRALEAERDALIEQLRNLSSTDFLTGLPNRRAFFEAAARELARARRDGQPVVVILLDVDEFKAFNDRHGHSLGDQALVGVAQALRQALRAGDLVARYGGEEFVLLLSGCDRAVGRQFAERLRQSIAAVRLGPAGQELLPVSASLGLADSAGFGTNLDELLLQADRAMYAAKAQGRNRLVVAAEGADLAARASAP